jgi:hypothetical protein
MKDFTKTMRLRDKNKASHSNTSDKVLRHHNIIIVNNYTSHQTINKIIDTTQNNKCQHSSQNINRSKPRLKLK